MAAEEEEEGGVGNDVCLLGKWVGRCGNEPILFRRILDMEETDGTLYLSQTPSARRRSLISQANIPGSFTFSSFMNPTTFGVVTLGLLPPMAPGRMDPVSLYRARIFETQPCDTLSCRLISQGRIPSWASSTILTRIWFGRGLPLTKTPPNWFTSP